MVQDMAESQFYKQLQEGISRWLKFGEKSGFTELESATVVLSSVLGKRSENQDRAIFLRVKFEKSRKPSIAALVLCDGMGGMVNGGECANLAISTFAASLVHSNASTLIEKLEVGIHDANEAVYNAFQGKGGATLSAVICNETKDWAAVNVGDSRIYCVLNSGVVEQLTIDDTLEKQLAALNLPSPPPEFRQLLQYVGMGEGIEPRRVELKPSSDMKWLLITSDGAHGIPENIFHSLVSYAESPREVVSRLTALSEWLGGKDNSTVAALTIGKDLFSRNEESDLSSLEIWSIPGKVEFFSIKASPTDSLPDKSLNTPDANASGVEEPLKQEKIPLPKKQPKKKNQDNAQKIEFNGVNSNKTNGGKGEVDKPVPQLNIEFSEEN